MALLISNQDAEQVLTMKACLESIEAGVKEYYAGDATCRPRIDVWAPAANSREALKGAEIVAACTDTTVPVVEGRYIEEGAFITTVKGSTEIDDDTLKRVDLFATFAPTVASFAGVSEAASASRAQRISANHRAYVAGRAEDLARIPEVRGARRMDTRKIVSFKDLFAGIARSRINPRQIISMAGNQIQGIQFASVGGLTYQLIKDKGLGREFPTDWLLQDIRN